MAKKHYIAIAELFKRHKAYDLAYEFCEIAERDNTHFDRKRFLAACGCKIENGELVAA